MGWGRESKLSITFHDLQEAVFWLTSIVLGTSLVAWMIKNPQAMQEIQAQSLGQEDPLEKGTAIHSSILAQRISWKEESGRLQYVRSQRVRHD